MDKHHQELIENVIEQLVSVKTIPAHQCYSNLREAQRQMDRVFACVQEKIDDHKACQASWYSQIPETAFLRLRMFLEPHSQMILSCTCKMWHRYNSFLKGRSFRKDFRYVRTDTILMTVNSHAVFLWQNGIRWKKNWMHVKAIAFKSKTAQNTSVTLQSPFFSDVSCVDTDERYHYLSLSKLKRLYLFRSDECVSLSLPLLYVDFPWSNHYPGFTLFQPPLLKTISAEPPGRIFRYEFDTTVWAAVFSVLPVVTFAAMSCDYALYRLNGGWLCCDFAHARFYSGKQEEKGLNSEWGLPQHFNRQSLSIAGDGNFVYVWAKLFHRLLKMDSTGLVCRWWAIQEDPSCHFAVHQSRAFYYRPLHYLVSMYELQ